MTAIVAIIVKERKKGNPFILAASDSKRSHTSGPNMGGEVFEVNEDAKKVFKYKDKFLAAAGSYRPLYFIDLVESFKKESMFIKNINQFQEFIKIHTLNYIEHETENYSLEILFGMMEDKKRPIVCVLTASSIDSKIKIEKFDSSVNNAELIRGGQIVPMECLDNFMFHDYSPKEVEKFTKMYISKAAELYPKTCNNKYQSEIIF